MKRFVFLLMVVFLTAIAANAQVAGDDDEGDPGNKVIRIGVLMPEVQLTDAKGELEPGEALRSTYAALMNSEKIELVKLDSKLSALAISEAKKLECDYILKVNLSQKTKKSGGGIFGRVIRDTGNRATYEASTKVPYGGNTGTRIARTTARSAIIRTGYTMSNMSIKVRKNDEFKIAYTLSTGEGKSVKDEELKAKAKKKNDDKVLLNLIEKSANNIATVIIERQEQ